MFFSIYEKLCAEHGEKPYALPLKLGAKSNSMVAQWKSGSIPRPDMLQKIADYFSVSVPYLMGYVDTKKEPTTIGGEHSAEDMELLKAFHSADEKTQAAIRLLLDNSKEGK